MNAKVYEMKENSQETDEISQKMDGKADDMRKESKLTKNK